MPPSEKRSIPSSTPSTTISAAALRAAVARDGRPLYVVGAAAGVHPTVIGRLLSGAIPMRQDIAARVLEVIRDPDADA